MKNNDQERRGVSHSFAPTILGHLGLKQTTISSERTYDTIMSALDSEEWSERVWAIRMFSQLIPGPGILETLAELLNDPIWQVRATAVFALAEHRESVSQELFLSALSDEEEAVRAIVVRVLGMLGEHMPVASIIAATSDPAWLVREAAILALGELGARAPVLPLITALHDEDFMVREAASLVLQQNHSSIASTLASQSALSSEQKRIDSWTPPQRQTVSGPEREEEKLLTGHQLDSTSTDLLDNPRPRKPGQKRFLWHVLESGAAALLLISLIFSWLALTQHLHFPSSAVQHAQTPTLQPVLPPIQQGNVLFTYRGEGKVFSSTWTADSRYLGFSNDHAPAQNQYVNEGEHIHIWDAVTGKSSETFILPSLPNKAQGLFFFGADRYLLLISNQGLLQVWDYVSGQKLLDINSPGTHGWPDWKWSKDQKFLEISSHNNSWVEIWNVARGERIAAYRAPTPANVSLEWSPDDRYLAAVSRKEELTVWNALTGTVILSVSHYDGTSTFWSPDSQRLVVVMPAEGQMQMWDVFSGKVLMTFPDAAQSIQWTNDGMRMFSSERTRWVLWDIRTGRALLTFPLSSSTWARVSPDGASVAYTPDDHTIQIWDTVTGRMIRTYNTSARDVHFLTASWSSDGQSLALLESDGILLIWNASLEKVLSAYHVSFLLAPDLIWSPNAKFIALTSQQPLLEVLDLGK